MARVWEAHADVDLVFVGRGDLEGALGAQASFSGHGERVHFLGNWQIPSAVRRAAISFAVESSNVCGLRVNGRDAGWVDEVKSLMQSVPADAPAWNASGYRTVAVQPRMRASFDPAYRRRTASQKPT